MADIRAGQHHPGSNPPLPPRPRIDVNRRRSANPVPPPKKSIQSAKTVGDLSPQLSGSFHSSFSGTPSSLGNSPSAFGEQHQYPPQHPPPTYTHSSPYSSQHNSISTTPTPSPSNSGNPPPLPGRPPPTRQRLQSSTDVYPQRGRGQPSGGGGGGTTPVHAQGNCNTVDGPQGDTYVATDTIIQLRQQYQHHHPQQWQQQHPPDPASSVVHPPIEDQDWYWGSISKEEVTEIMKDAPTGSYLVRDAARVAGYYTLTLRKGGVNRLIRIMHKDGQFGFAEPLEFNSVVGLVEYYKEHSLAPYSPKLDITLGSPVSRRHDMDRTNLSDDHIIDRLRIIEEDLRIKSREYNNQKQQFERVNEEIKNMRTDIAAQGEIINIIGESLTEHKKQHNSCPAQLRLTVMANYDLLERRHRINKDSHQELQEKVQRSEKTKNCIDTELNNLKPEIKQMQQERGDLYRVLSKRGMSNHDITLGIQGTGEEEGEAEEEEGLYATYAMLHAIRKESDYQRISEEIRKRGRRPPPPPPTGTGNSMNMSGGSRSSLELPSPQNEPPPPRNIPRDSRMRMNTVVERPPIHVLPGVEDFDGHLIDAGQLKLPLDLPHFRTQTWMNPTIMRDGSRAKLTGKPNGTFLVRPKPGVEDAHITTPTHSHTIDIIDRGKFKRIPVFRDPGGGFGFAPPYEFDSLNTLVLYYATNTMEKHNPDLETTLMYPAFS